MHIKEWCLLRCNHAYITGIDCKKIIRALRRAGFEEVRQKGSHVMLMHPQSGKRTVVPVHAGKIIKRPLLLAIINDVGLSKQEFIDFLK